MRSEGLPGTKGPVHHHSESMSDQRKLCITIATRNQIVHGLRIEVHRFQQWRPQYGLAGCTEKRLEKQGNFVQSPRRTCAKGLDRSNATRLEQSLHVVWIHISKFWRVYQQTGLPKRLIAHQRMERRRVEIMATLNWNLRSTHWTTSVHLMNRIGTPDEPHLRDRYTQWANQALFRPFVVHPLYSFNITRGLGV